MKADLRHIVPVPVPDEIVLTLSIHEAEALMVATSRIGGSLTNSYRGVFSDLREHLHGCGIRQDLGSHPHQSILDTQGKRGGIVFRDFGTY